MVYLWVTFLHFSLVFSHFGVHSLPFSKFPLLRISMSYVIGISVSLLYFTHLHLSHLLLLFDFGFFNLFNLAKLSLVQPFLTPFILKCVSYVLQHYSPCCSGSPWRNPSPATVSYRPSVYQWLSATATSCVSPPKSTQWPLCWRWRCCSIPSSKRGCNGTKNTSRAWSSCNSNVAIEQLRIPPACLKIYDE